MTALRFLDIGVITQLVIETPDDLARIGEVDEARWTATSAPVDQLFCDPAFLGYMDTDKNGRVRVVEMKEAVRWLWAHLQNRARVVERSDAVHLADIDVAHPDAVKMKALAERLLGQLDESDRSIIRLEQVRRFKAGYTRRFPNGDGVVTAAQIEDLGVKAAIDEIVKSTGGTRDLSEDMGVAAKDLGAWRERLSASAAWHARSVVERDALFPLGDDTPAAGALLDVLEPKVAQFFAQCALVAIEENARGRLSASPDELKLLDIKDPAAIEGWLKAAPLARPNVEGVLPLQGAVNPGFAAALATLADDVGPRVLGKPAPLTSLDQATWAALKGKLAAHRAWRTERPLGVDEAITQAQAEEKLASSSLTRIAALIAEDEGVAAELVEFTNLEKLVLFHRWLFELANNFVSIPHLFAPTRRTLFEMGTLILDGRRFNLCVKVVGKDAHMKTAASSEMYLVYFEIARKEGDVDKKDLVATAVTSGTRGGVAVGKRGVFYDRDGVEWDALIVSVVENPISILEAMVAPFVRLRNAIGERVGKIAGSKAAAFEKQAADTTGSDAAAAAAPSPPKELPQKADGGMGMSTLLVGGGVAFAAVGSSLAFMVKTLVDVNPWSVVGALAAVVAGLALVSGFLGWLKLRRRDVAALLEACGWALNSRMRLRRPLTTLFTRRPPLPQGAVVRRTAKSPAGFLIVVLIAALLGAAFMQAGLYDALIGP